MTLINCNQIIRCDYWSGRQAITVRVVNVIEARALPDNSLCPRGHPNSFRGQILGQVEVVALNETTAAVIDAALRRPDAGEVGCAVGEFRRFRRQVGRTIGKAGNPGRGIVQPLPSQRHRRCDKEGTECGVHMSPAILTHLPIGIVRHAGVTSPAVADQPILYWPEAVSVF